MADVADEGLRCEFILKLAEPCMGARVASIEWVDASLLPLLCILVVEGGRPEVGGDWLVLAVSVCM